MWKSNVLVSAVATSLLWVAVAPPAVAAQARQPKLTPAVVLAFATTAVDIARAPGVLTPGADIEEIAFIVLMESARSADQDLEAIMAEVEAQTRAKDSLRQLQADESRLEAALTAERGGCTKPC